MRQLVTRAAMVLVAAAAAVSLAAVPTASAATVLTVQETLGIGAGEMTDLLGGSVCHAPANTCVEVVYPAVVGPDSVPAGVVALDEAIAATPAPMIVMGYSQGAIVAGHWLREHAADPGVPSTEDLSFVLVGNPARAFGGAYVPLGDTTPQTQYTVTDVARQYDLFADFPNKPFSPFFLLALANAVMGIQSVHLDYTQVNPDDPANARWTVDNTTYVLTPTHDLPLLQPLRTLGCDRLADALNTPLKAMVDRAYRRPEPFPGASDIREARAPQRAPRADRAEVRRTARAQRHEAMTARHDARSEHRTARAPQKSGL
ncbi:PE-PPE domain-containing protein [Mycolicibacterium chubuense]|uniref:Putative PPE family protein PPE42 n=1 Tax=Mycolicibacterium chubuense TaxID=1800 RepID=A0A0J6W9P8_MYCCU|nr:PE-PPE domain-containing protein [Mycolicibacterium chubuense]KMO79319.1 putative PPE family protein PPE42 [Mycolicibacterium chubuense]ORA52463.1 PE-PPE domain-containing protein [Mycolicibacterium chubuense]SPX99499.1 TetR family transcriptional regulator [Mycolicibacterium chubuense]